MPGTFAGYRKNADLGRSGTQAAGLVPLQAALPTTTGALWKKEEGNVVSVREAHALGVIHRTVRHETRTRPSLGPETRARRSALGFFERGISPRKGCKESPAVDSVSKSGKPTQVGGTGGGAWSNGRSAARRVSPLRSQELRSCVMRKKRKVVMAIVPARKQELRAERPYVVSSCRSRQAASRPRISPHAALQKE
jgi:hypothetical protein